MRRPARLLFAVVTVVSGVVCVATAALWAVSYRRAVVLDRRPHPVEVLDDLTLPGRQTVTVASGELVVARNVGLLKGDRRWPLAPVVVATAALPAVRLAHRLAGRRRRRRDGRKPGRSRRGRARKER